MLYRFYNDAFSLKFIQDIVRVWIDDEGDLWAKTDNFGSCSITKDEYETLGKTKDQAFQEFVEFINDVLSGTP